MRRDMRAVATGLALVTGLGCQARPPAETGERVVAARFQPPPDGRLNEAQVAMYRAVAEQSPTSPSPPPRVVHPMDLVRPPGGGRSEAAEAASLLGYDPEEYEWVQARVMEARIPEAALHGLAPRLRASALESLGAERARASSAEEKARLDRQVAALEAARSGEGGAGGAREHNRALLEALGVLGSEADGR